MGALALTPSALPVPIWASCCRAKATESCRMVWASGHPPKLSIPASAFEVPRCKYQAHQNHGTKNNEDDALHGVNSLLKNYR